MVWFVQILFGFWFVWMGVVMVVGYCGEFLVDVFFGCVGGEYF